MCPTLTYTYTPHPQTPHAINVTKGPSHACDYAAPYLVRPTNPFTTLRRQNHTSPARGPSRWDSSLSSPLRSTTIKVGTYVTGAIFPSLKYSS